MTFDEAPRQPSRRCPTSSYHGFRYCGSRAQLRATGHEYNRHLVVVTKHFPRTVFKQRSEVVPGPICCCLTEREGSYLSVRMQPGENTLSTGIQEYSDVWPLFTMRMGGGGRARSKLKAWNGKMQRFHLFSFLL